MSVSPCRYFWSTGYLITSVCALYLNLPQSPHYHHLTTPVLFHFYPPTRVCLDPHCNMEPEGRELTEPVQHQATLFTKNHGPIPVYTTSLYCCCKCCQVCNSLVLTLQIDCHTRYHHNYYVHSHATLCTYYSNISNFIQCTKKTFIDKGLCERFANQMAFA